MDPHQIVIARINESLPRQDAIATLKHEILGSDLHYTATGRPYLPKSYNVSISISHSLHWIAIGVNCPYTQPVGIDIEEKADQASRILDRYSTPNERQLLREFNRVPIELWTAKEAVYKAYSEQLSRGINQIEWIGGYHFRAINDSGECLFQDVHWVQRNGFVLAHTLPENIIKLQISCTE